MWNDDHGKIQLVIDELRETLVLKVKYDTIQLAVRRFISEMSADRIEAERKSSQDRMMSLLSEVSSCSQEDFDQFLVVVAQSYGCLEETIQRAYFKGFGCRLDVPRINRPVRVRGDPARVEETQEPFLNLNVNLRHQVPATGAASDDVYEMDWNYPGLCLIINNRFSSDTEYFRRGSEKDVENLEHLFKDFLKFKVTTKTDLTAEAMRIALADHARDASTNPYSALAVVLMSHGGEDDYIYGIDLVPGNRATGINRSHMMDCFSTLKCPAMKGKPKLFILQACRGHGEDTRGTIVTQESSNQTSSGLQLERDTIGSGTPRSARTADTCFLFASSPGYVAYRDRNRGSIFVREFTRFIKDHADNKMYREILDMMIQKFNGMDFDDEETRTMPEYTSTLTKKLRLKPPLQAQAAAP